MPQQKHREDSLPVPGLSSSRLHIAGLARDFGQSDDITILTLDFA